jgi:hypothetical protein
MALIRYSGVEGVSRDPVPHFFVFNFRSEKKYKDARLSDGRGAYKDCDTDDEFTMVQRAKGHGDKQPQARTFYDNVRDYMISYVTRTNNVLTDLRDNISLFSVPVLGGRTYYRGQKINPLTLHTLRNQPMDDPANEAFTHALIHGFLKEENPSPSHPGIPFRHKGKVYTHHGISSISTMYKTGKRYGLKKMEHAAVKAMGDIPLLLKLETPKENPFRAVIPIYNYYPSKFLKHNPSSEHEMLLDLKKNKYRLTSVKYDYKREIWVATVRASADSSQAPQTSPFRPKVKPTGSARAHAGTSNSTGSRKGPVTFNPKITSDDDKLATWNKIAKLLKNAQDFSLEMNSKGKVFVNTNQPPQSYRKTVDSDKNALVSAAAQRGNHIAEYSHKPFVVIQDMKNSIKRPHLLILPTPVRKKNYKDLREFLKSASRDQKIALWDTMVALINNTKDMPATDTLFKTNGGAWQAIPYFSIHYTPYLKD